MISPAVIEALEAIPGLGVRRGEAMAGHSVWRVGGPVPLFLIGESEAAIKAATKVLSEAKLRLRGLEGERVLVRDGGVDGAWLRPGRLAEVLDLDVPIVGGRVAAAVLASAAERAGLGGLASLRVVAGSVAEAIRAGRLGGQIRELRVLKGSRIGTVTPADLRDNHTILTVTLELEPAMPQELAVQGRKAVRDAVGVGEGLPGRIVGDPKGESAARLMAEAGLCGVRLRTARLGVREPNAVLTAGPSSASDVLLLTKLAQDRVKTHSGRQLPSLLSPIGVNAGGSPRRDHGR